jgi:hypothetical protein
VVYTNLELQVLVSAKSLLLILENLDHAQHPCIGESRRDKKQNGRLRTKDKSPTFSLIQ